MSYQSNIAPHSGVAVWPGVDNWHSSSYSPATGRLYVPLQEVRTSLQAGRRLPARRLFRWRDLHGRALDARTGKHLWRFPTGGPIYANPISYLAGGRQYVAIAAGDVLFAFGLD